MKRLKQVKSLPKDAKPQPGTGVTTKNGTTIERWSHDGRYYEVIQYRSITREVYEIVTDA